MEKNRSTQKLKRRIEQLKAFLDASAKLTTNFDLQNLISEILSTVVNVLDIESSSLWLLDPEKGELFTNISVGERDDETMQYRLKIGEGIAGKVGQTGEMILKQSRAKNAPRAILCVPLKALAIRGLWEEFEESIVGVIELIHQEHRVFSKEDVDLIQAFSNLAAIAINNQRLFVEVQDALYTVQTLADAIDIKDPVTSGHSRRVTQLSLAIYDELNDIPEERRYIELAGLLHDVGKIGIREEVLMKPGSLTPEEFKHMEEHPTIGYHLLKGPRFLRKILPAVLYNQERYDGKGYPKGLKGEEIPLSARIIAVADAFDAMTNDRPYRKALSVEEALEEIRKNSGTQFDPKVVEAFFKAFKKGKIRHSWREGEKYYVEKDEE
jgi:HD-GYP domain-containing protein (c-di-GMP phosphodiesterase class II)